MAWYVQLLQCQAASALLPSPASSRKRRAVGTFPFKYFFLFIIIISSFKTVLLFSLSCIRHCLDRIMGLGPSE